MWKAYFVAVTDGVISNRRSGIMSKGQESKKEAKKKPAKTLMEKRAEKKAKKGK